MKNNKPRPQRAAAPPQRTPDEAGSEEPVKPDHDASSEYHDAGHPGGLPDLDKKTETEAEHDSWGGHG